MSLTVKLSQITARIATLVAEKEELEARIAAGYVDPDQVQPGRRVAFEYGRPAKTYMGNVIARKETEGKGKGAQVKILVGEGFETEVLTVHPNAVLRFEDLAAVTQAVPEVPAEGPTSGLSQG